MKKNQIIWFPEVRKAEIKEVEMPVPGPGQYLVKSRVTLISTGTEMTAYCGEFEPGTNWEKNFSCPYYPGYTCIGEIVEAGEGADRSMIGRRMATDQPHQAYGLSSGDDPASGEQFHGRSRFQPVPDGIEQGRQSGTFLKPRMDQNVLRHAVQQRRINDLPDSVGLIRIRNVSTVLNHGSGSSAVHQDTGNAVSAFGGCMYDQFDPFHGKNSFQPDVRAGKSRSRAAIHIPVHPCR